MALEIKKCMAEFLGSFILVLAVAMMAAATGNVFIVALTNGIALLAAIFITLRISGAQITPVVTLALILAEKEEPARGVSFIVSQLIGGLAASCSSCSAATPSLAFLRLARTLHSCRVLLPKPWEHLCSSPPSSWLQ
ncbi:hypothetical protein COT30_04030 [Candidatus Micrarchaeota archaeon CG08_land_8_20_14_0_20_49_17]|nr:MAG: hypothetical protein AUJ13_03440 [Candidatus Micrarchaeota archaeon CG1_02_49_24]PIU09510.1 MAG: hypothetical protein COT30_04030 [Candidatus Micrarchaeota archaeon CG08_land_8_20_14_0_20_49_17]HII54120.1 hypothetical protein [Candidatus Micrarchaeota archaeon]